MLVTFQGEGVRKKDHLIQSLVPTLTSEDLEVNMEVQKGPSMQGCSPKRGPQL